MLQTLDKTAHAHKRDRHKRMARICRCTTHLEILGFLRGRTATGLPLPPLRCRTACCTKRFTINSAASCKQLLDLQALKRAALPALGGQFSIHAVSSASRLDECHLTGAMPLRCSCSNLCKILSNIPSAGRNLLQQLLCHQMQGHQRRKENTRTHPRAHKHTQADMSGAHNAHAQHTHRTYKNTHTEHV